jgi:hypothetical protein
MSSFRAADGQHSIDSLPAICKLRTASGGRTIDSTESSSILLACSDGRNVIPGIHLFLIDLGRGPSTIEGQTHPPPAFGPHRGIFMDCLSGQQLAPASDPPRRHYEGPGWRTGGAFGAALATGLLTAAMLVPPKPSVQAAEPALDALAAEYTSAIRPLVQHYCVRCHGEKRQEAEVNLGRFAALAEVRKDSRTWQKVLEMLDSGQMPPQEARQPSEEDRGRLRKWVRTYLKMEAKASAGDPGPVVLRRINNAQYTYTIRDLTDVDLRPARNFPADGAAGEGFTNTGQALVMSPALLGKYLDAAKEIAAHAVLLPDGIRFSPATSRQDWTNEILAQIRETYNRYADSRGGTRVNLQGIVFDTNDGGRLPLERYLAATVEEREALAAGTRTLAAVAAERRLSARYLTALWEVLNDREPSPLLDAVRLRWRNARPGDVAALAAAIGQWQAVLTKFQKVGHLKSWMVPAVPLTPRQEVRLKVPAAGAGKETILYLAAGDAGDGADQDFVVWRRPRLVIPGRPDLPLRDVRAFTSEILALRERYFAAAAKCLATAAEVSGRQEPFSVAELARQHETDADALAAWLECLGFGTTERPKLDYLTNKMATAGGYDFVKGWGTSATPLLVANSSDRHVRIPGNMKPHGVCVHPSPRLQIVIGWRSPVAGVFRVTGQVTHAHPECGNGIAWALEVRRGGTRKRLAAGIAQGGKPVAVSPFERLTVQKGDLVSLVVDPRDGNHACDLTDLELVLKQVGGDGREWSLTRDVSADVLAGNPHADAFGNADVWHFYTEPVAGSTAGFVIPAGSVLDRWLEADNPAARRDLAGGLQKLLTSGPPTNPKSPDAILYRQLASLGGPLFARAKPGAAGPGLARGSNLPVGLDPALFGRHPNGSALDPDSLCVQAPSLLEIRLPSDLFAGAEFVTTGTLHPQTGAEGSVQLQAATTPPALGGLRPDLPLVVNDGSAARKRWERSFDGFRRCFPAALCYTKIVPVDEVITLTLFHREDEPLCRLFLDTEEKARLDALWEELHFVSQDALTSVDAFRQLLEYASQDSDPKLFEPFRKPIHERAAAYRQQLLDAEPRHLNAVLEFAARAYRRPLSNPESEQLRDLYRTLRDKGLPHDEAIRFTLARVLVSPAFLYRLEKAAPGDQAAPVSDGELASRLSYFLWSSLPDADLRDAAAAGRLRDPEVLTAQARRMLHDDRVRRLATEFACQWLHVYGFDALDEKSERHFPTFAGLRGAMYEEAIRFFTDLFQRDASVLSILDADHTFVNEVLAKHYGIPGVSGLEWRRVDGVRQYGRGGILGLAATLAAQSGASRTSPILRGNWVFEVLLGERLPRPPKDVPRLPEDEAATEGLTVRQLVEKHTSDARCAVCHVRIDPFGYALEGFDAIGRRRDRDLANRPIDTRTKLPDGTAIDGADGLRQYLVTKRRDDVLRQFCRKLLGFALGRGVRLSDEPLLDEMRQRLETHEYRFSAAVEAIVRSRQFREVRGKDFHAEESRHP